MTMCLIKKVVHKLEFHDKFAKRLQSLVKLSLQLYTNAVYKMKFFIYSVKTSYLV